MGWLQRMRVLFGRPLGCGEAAAAGVAAAESHRQAITQRDEMAVLRAEADRLTAQVKAHNTANRYDDFLRRIIQGGS